MPRVFRGTHVQLPCVHVFRAREVAISCERTFAMYADGDPIGDLPLRVRALQGAVAMLTPRDAGAQAPFAAAAASPGASA
jgi:diacylglycerol kinase family enzyme